METSGSGLKKIRLERGISLEDVQKNTKIHLNILKAIEGDSISDINPVYLRGFLKIYCKYLGLDYHEYITDYKEAQTKANLTTGSKVIPGKKDFPVVFLKNALARLTAIRIPKKIRSGLILGVTIILISVVLFNLGKHISARVRAGLAQRKTAAPLPKTSVKKQLPQAKSKISSTVTPISTPKVSKAKPKNTQAAEKKEALSVIRLGIRTKSNCWVSVKADGRLVFQRVLEKGRFENWQAKEKIELSLGNAGAVELEVNGQLFSNLGRSGQSLKNIMITKEGLNIQR